MAFKDAKIGFFPSSTGHGGIVTIYDKESTLDGPQHAAAAMPYFDREAPARTRTTNLTARRTYEALVDFCEAAVGRQHPVLGEWVVCFTASAMTEAEPPTGSTPTTRTSSRLRRKQA